MLLNKISIFLVIFKIFFGFLGVGLILAVQLFNFLESNSPDCPAVASKLSRLALVLHEGWALQSDASPLEHEPLQ